LAGAGLAGSVAGSVAGSWGSVLELLRAPDDGATGVRRHDALYAAGLYESSRSATPLPAAFPASSPARGADPAEPVDLPPSLLPRGWWVPFGGGTNADTDSGDEGWW
jgi:hypothetical protein